MVGGNHEAVEEAEFLTKFAATVHWITPRAPKANDPHVQALLSMPNVKHWGGFKVESIEGDASGVSGLRLKPRKGGAAEQPVAEAQLLAVAGVFIYGSGTKPIVDFLGKEVAIKDDGGVWVDDEMKTTAAGVYAIGDIVNGDHKQAVVAAAAGCVAAMSIDRYLNGHEDVQLDWDHT